VLSGTGVFDCKRYGGIKFESLHATQLGSGSFSMTVRTSAAHGPKASVVPTAVIAPHFSSTSGAVSTPVLLIVAGQSNARTSGTLLATAGRYASLTNAYIWVAGSSAFAAYAAGVNSDSQGDGAVWGSEAEFIYQMNAAQPGRKVYVVKEAENGATIANSGNNAWYPDAPADHFFNLKDQVTAARAALSGVSYTDYALWCQGEGDSNEADQTAAYYANFHDAFLPAYRSQISTGTFLIERIRPCIGDDGTGTKTYNRAYTIRAAQEALAAGDATVKIISLDFDPTNFDVIHPGTTGTPPWAEAKGLRCYAMFDGTYDGTYGAIADTSPSNLSFTDITDALQSTVTTSTEVTIDGIGCGTAISITGGEFRIRNRDDTDWSAWGSSSATIHPFQKLALRVTSSASVSTAVNVVVTVGSGSDTWTVTTAASPPSYEDETDAFIAKIAGLGGGTMTTPQAQALDAFYVAAKASAWWAKVKRLYVGGMHDQIASSIDFTDQTTTLTQIGNTGNCTWTLDVGWSAGGNQGCGLDMHADPSALTTQNDICLFYWCPDFSLTAGTSSTADIQSSDGTVRTRINEAGSAQTRLHAGSNQTKTSLSTTAGFRAVSRTASTTTKWYKGDGTQDGTTGTTASQAMSATNLYMFAAVSGSTAARTLLVSGIATGLSDAEVLGLRDALNTLGGAFWL
jgi:hypothetical protein